MGFSSTLSTTWGRQHPQPFRDLTITSTIRSVGPDPNPNRPEKTMKEVAGELDNFV